MAKICLVCHNALPAIFPEQGAAVGGAETRAWAFARGLVRYTSHQVQFFVRTPGPLARASSEGVRLVAQQDPFLEHRRYVSRCLQSGLRWPGLRQFKAGLLWRVPWLAVTWPFRRRDLPPCQPDPQLLSLDCDLYMALGTDVEASQVVATACSRGKPVLISLKANSDIPTSTTSLPAVAGDVARFVLQHATLILAQTQTQADALPADHQHPAGVLRTPIDLEEWQPAIHQNSEPYVLWVGRADRHHKRPQLALEMAQALPEIPFLMILNQGDDEVEKHILKNKPRNLTIRSDVPPSEMKILFQKARLFLSTSAREYEGFPNVFLQAAATQTPILSYYDHDQFLDRAQAGLVLSDAPSVAIEQLKAAWSNSASLIHIDQTQDILRKDYNMETLCRELGRCIDSVLSKD